MNRKLLEEGDEYDATLRKILANILNWSCKQSPAPVLPATEVRELRFRGFLNERGEVTLEGFEFLEAG